MNVLGVQVSRMGWRNKLTSCVTVLFAFAWPNSVWAQESSTMFNHGISEPHREKVEQILAYRSPPHSFAENMLKLKADNLTETKIQELFPTEGEREKAFQELIFETVFAQMNGYDQTEKRNLNLLAGMGQQDIKLQKEFVLFKDVLQELHPNKFPTSRYSAGLQLIIEMMNFDKQGMTEKIPDLLDSLEKEAQKLSSPTLNALVYYYRGEIYSEPFRIFAYKNTDQILSGNFWSQWHTNDQTSEENYNQAIESYLQAYMKSAQFAQVAGSDLLEIRSLFFLIDDFTYWNKELDQRLNRLNEAKLEWEKLYSSGLWQFRATHQTPSIYYEKVLEKAREIQRPELIARSQVILGKLHSDSKGYQFMAEALEYYKQEKNEGLELIITKNLANYLLEKDPNHVKIEPYLNRAEFLAQKLELPDWHIATLISLAQHHQKQRRLAEAETYLIEAQKESRLINSLFLLDQAQRYQAKLLKESNKKTEANAIYLKLLSSPFVSEYETTDNLFSLSQSDFFEQLDHLLLTSKPEIIVRLVENLGRAEKFSLLEKHQHTLIQLLKHDSLKVKEAALDALEPLSLSPEKIPLKTLLPQGQWEFNNFTKKLVNRYPSQNQLSDLKRILNKTNNSYIKIDIMESIQIISPEKFFQISKNILLDKKHSDLQLYLFRVMKKSGYPFQLSQLLHICAIKGDYNQSEDLYLEVQNKLKTISIQELEPLLNHKDEKVVSFVFEALKTKQAVPLIQKYILKNFEKVNTDTQREFLKFMILNPNKAYLKGLKQALGKGNDHFVLEALTQYPQPEIMPLLLTQLEKNPHFIFPYLGKLKNRKYLNKIEPYLKNEYFEIAFLAFQAMVEIQPENEEKYLNIVRKHPDFLGHGYKNLLQNYEKKPSVAYLQILIEDLRQMKPTDRRFQQMTYEISRRFSREQIKELLSQQKSQFAATPELYVRIWSNILTYPELPEFLDILYKIETKKQIDYLDLITNLSLGESVTIAWLLECLNTANLEQQLKILNVLGKLGNRDIGPKLLPFLTHPSGSLKYTVLETLKSLGFHSQDERIRVLLTVPDPETSRLALNIYQQNFVDFTEKQKEVLGNFQSFRRNLNQACQTGDTEALLSNFRELPYPTQQRELKHLKNRCNSPEVLRPFFRNEILNDPESVSNLTKEWVNADTRKMIIEELLQAFHAEEVYAANYVIALREIKAVEALERLERERLDPHNFIQLKLRNLIVIMHELGYTNTVPVIKEMLSNSTSLIHRTDAMQTILRLKIHVFLPDLIAFIKNEKTQLIQTKSNVDADGFWISDTNQPVNTLELPYQQAILEELSFNEHWPSEWLPLIQTLIQRTDLDQETLLRLLLLKNAGSEFDGAIKALSQAIKTSEQLNLYQSLASEYSEKEQLISKLKMLFKSRNWDKESLKKWETILKNKKSNFEYFEYFEKIAQKIKLNQSNLNQISEELAAIYELKRIKEWPPQAGDVLFKLWQAEYLNRIQPQNDSGQHSVIESILMDQKMTPETDLFRVNFNSNLSPFKQALLLLKAKLYINAHQNDAANHLLLTIMNDSSSLIIQKLEAEWLLASLLPAQERLTRLLNVPNLINDQLPQIYQVNDWRLKKTYALIADCYYQINEPENEEKYRLLSELN